MKKINYKFMKTTITILTLMLVTIFDAKSQIDKSQIDKSQIEKNQLANLFSVDVEFAVKDTYSSYLKSAQLLNLTYSHSTVWSINQNPNNITSVKKVLILVNSTALLMVQDKILRYANDIHLAYGSEIIIEQCTGSTYSDIKNLILTNKSNLTGVVLIGDLPAAWYEMANDFDQYGYQEWPCDLYYMDIDGVWSDTSKNGIFDTHSGNVQPEIFVGRISTANMGTLLIEKTGLENYFEKNHKYWIGQFSVKKKFGLSYTDKDWVPFPYFLNDIGNLYGTSNYDKIDAINNSSIFGSSDYLNRLSNDRYEFIQLSCHSLSYAHYMTGGRIYTNEIFNNGTKAIAYNLFCCSGCRWTEVKPNSTQCFLGGAYVYNNNSSGLVLVGSTKIGSMLGFSLFYSSLSKGLVFGSSLKDWWLSYCGVSHDKSEISWHYGLSIIGDPLINLTNCISITCEDKDGDGYYYWGGDVLAKGIKPFCSFDEKDGDDSNPYLGPLDGDGRCRSLSTLEFEKTYISTKINWYTNSDLCNMLYVQPGGNLQIYSTVSMPDASKWTNFDYRDNVFVEYQGTLNIDQGKLINAEIVAQPGSQIFINNGGCIQMGKSGGFTINDGAIFEMNYGEINTYQ